MMSRKATLLITAALFALAGAHAMGLAAIAEATGKTGTTARHSDDGVEAQAAGIGLLTVSGVLLVTGLFFTRELEDDMDDIGQALQAVSVEDMLRFRDKGEPPPA